MENSNFLKETISLWPVHPLLFGVRSCETEWFAKQSRKMQRRQPLGKENWLRI